jgi:hypothetical protein
MSAQRSPILEQQAPLRAVLGSPQRERRRSASTGHCAGNLRHRKMRNLSRKRGEAMDAAWKGALWQQFGAAIDTMENALVACPESIWGDRSRVPEFWYVVFHTLFFLDYYLSDSPDGFAPPTPFTLDELDPAGVLPDRVYTKAELGAYLAHGREKCRAAIEALTDQTARRVVRFGSVEGTGLERLLYNMRHVQHHAAQLNLTLRQDLDHASPWVSRAKTDLHRAPRDLAHDLPRS